MKKVAYWLIDYVYLFRGGAAMYLHRNPPGHYTNFVVEDKSPVILVPGFLEKWGFLKRLGDFISLKGHPTYIVPDLGHNIADVPSASKTLRLVVLQAVSGSRHYLPDIQKGAKKLREVLENQNIQRAVIVAHSKGGLIGKYYLVHHNQDKRVVGMVAIAAPFAGSALARLVPHPSAQELVARHKLIQDLEKHSGINHQIISIYPTFDNHIWTENGSFLEGAENIQVSLSGHNRVLFNKDVKKLVLKSVEKLSRYKET
jgi:triacylglycerol lipase